jgi:hypothetical protein
MFMGAQSKTNTAGKLLELVWSIGYTLPPFLGINGTISTSGCSDLDVWVSGLFDISVATAIFLLQEYVSLNQLKDPLSGGATVGVVVKAKQYLLARFLLLSFLLYIRHLERTLLRLLLHFCNHGYHYCYC